MAGTAVRVIVLVRVGPSDGRTAAVRARLGQVLSGWLVESTATGAMAANGKMPGVTGDLGIGCQGRTNRRIVRLSVVNWRLIRLDAWSGPLAE
jgi:hypothetical protein